MPSVADLTALYSNFMLGPRHGPGVCRTCFNLTNGFDRCYACLQSPGWLDAVAPISYSVAHEQLHHVLAGYKRSTGGAARRHQVELAAVLWRHIHRHEPCLARVAGTVRFDLVTTVPSSDAARDDVHPLHRIVGELVGPTRARHARRLARTDHPAPAPHEFSEHRYECTEALNGESILLIDDTWTTGASAQSAAAALKSGGAGHVAALVIGRYVNRGWRQNDRRLRGLAGDFDWDQCALCAPEMSATPDLPEVGLASRGGG